MHDVKTNQLYTGDCLYVLHGMNSESVDLIYIDPPFNSKRMYKAPVGSKAAGSSFKDMWTWQDVDEAYLESMVKDYPYIVQYIQSISAIYGKPMMSYVTYMAQRIIEMHRVLNNTGSIYLHCDPTASHYLKIIMDRIFGKDNFVNEIVWCYRTGGASKKRWGKKHDIILMYSKQKSFYFNPQKEKSYLTGKFGFKETHHLIHKDGDGRYYTLVNCRDYWNIDAVGRTSKERTGYPTQKPLGLLHRIIKASLPTNGEESVVLDPFCGCATALVAAQQLGHRWIGIDSSEKSAELVADRLSDDIGIFTDFVHLSSPPKRTDIEEVPATDDVRQKLYEKQEGKCNACDVEMEKRNLELDHIIPKAKGGGNYYENYQLLCGHCNRVKGDKHMEYLRAKIEKRNRQMKFQVSFGA